MVLRVGYLLWHVKFSESKWAELNVLVSGTLLLGWCFDPIQNYVFPSTFSAKSSNILNHADSSQLRGYVEFPHYISVLTSTYLEWSWKLIYRIGMFFFSFWLPERNPIRIFCNFIEETGITWRTYSLLAHLPFTKHCILHTR